MGSNVIKWIKKAMSKYNNGEQFDFYILELSTADFYGLRGKSVKLKMLLVVDEDGYFEQYHWGSSTFNTGSMGGVMPVIKNWGVELTLIHKGIQA